MSGQRALQPATPPAQQPQRDVDGPDLLSQVEVCARLGISDQSWMRWRKAGRTPEPVLLPSGRRKWRRVDIDRITGSLSPAAGGGPRRYFGAVGCDARGQLVALRGAGRGRG